MKVLISYHTDFGFIYYTVFSKDSVPEITDTRFAYQLMLEIRDAQPTKVPLMIKYLGIGLVHE